MRDSLSEWEKSALQRGFCKIAGVDEAGRGPLAGPVVAACCLFTKPIRVEGIADSKLLTAEARERCFAELKEDPSVFFAIGEASVEEVDRHNILQATFLAMGRAVEAMEIPPDFLLIDGNLCPSFPVPAVAIVGGDQKCKPISAASIIAKCHRDQMMREYHKLWPEYGFASHKGYGTQQHQEALAKHGPSPIHRKSFAPIAKFFTTGSKAVQNLLFLLLFNVLR